MAKSGCRLEWNGLDKALSSASRKLASVEDELLASIGEALVSSTTKRFMDERGPDGKGWKPSQRAATTGGKTLTDTGRLRNSIDYATARGKVMVGSNVRYARIHQLGGKTGRGHKVNMPARPYLGFSKADLEEVKGTIAHFLARAFK